MKFWTVIALLLLASLTYLFYGAGGTPTIRLALWQSILVITALALILGVLALLVGGVCGIMVGLEKLLRKKPLQKVPDQEMEGYPPFYTGEKDVDGQDSIHPHYMS